MPSEKKQQWFTDHGVTTEVDALLADASRSVVVVTYPGSGITTSLSLLRSYKLLTFRYNPDQWPGGKEAFTQAETHFGQWMGLLAYTFIDELKDDRAVSYLLRSDQYEFLVWMAGKYLNRRKSDILLQFLERMLGNERWTGLRDKLEQGYLDNLYGDTVADVIGQIDECLDIASSLGWEGIYASIDISLVDWIERTSTQREHFMTELRRLLTTLTPLQRRGFGIKMGLPPQILSLRDVNDLVRGRAVVSMYHWEKPALLAITASLLATASSCSVEQSHATASSLWDQFIDDVKEIWVTPGPAAAVALAEAAYNTGLDYDKTEASQLRRWLYEHKAVLRLDGDAKQRTIWRGMLSIKLDETPFRFFASLWDSKGDQVDNETLLLIAGSKGNLDKNISRIREALEPFYKDQQYIYIQRTQGSGTWLVKERCAFLT